MPRQSHPPGYNKRHTETERSDLPIILALLCIGIIVGVVAYEFLYPHTADAPTDQGTTADSLVPTANPDDAAGEPLQTPLPLPTAVSEPPELPLQQPTPAPEYAATFFDPQHFSYTPDFYQADIEAFLREQSGDLDEVRFQIGDRSQSLAETLVSMSSLYSINPKIILTLMVQQGYTKDDPELYKHFYTMTIDVRQGLRDYALAANGSISLPDLVFKKPEEGDEARQKVPHDIGLAHYAIARVLAKTTEKPEELPRKLDTFLKTYTRLFDDPRVPPTEWPAPARPFLSRPMQHAFRITAVFDHDTPFLQRNGSTHSFWGYASPALPYDGHSGWDYAMKPPDVILAAADGQVVFAGNSDDGCYTPARGVIIDHGNGYRTLYWHLNAISVEAGHFITRGSELGVAGDSGCSFGPHLHFQVQYLGRDVDPYGWCGEGAGPWAANPAGQQSTWLWSDMIPPCGPPPPDIVVVDEHMPGFATVGDWEQLPYGYGGSALYAGSIHLKTVRPPWEVRPLVDTPAVATWSPDLPHAGRYRVLAYIPHVVNGLDDSRAVRYRVHHYDGDADVMLDAETHANSWADLGTYYFGPDEKPLVSLSALAGDHGRGIWADAVIWEPVE